MNAKKFVTLHFKLSPNQTMSNLSNLIDALCYGSIYSHIKDKDSGNTKPDRYAINHGRQYVMITLLMYLNTPTFILSAMHVIGNQFWLIYTIATFIIIFPLGYSILNKQRIERICQQYSNKELKLVDKANKLWFKFYHIAAICFFISLLVRLLIR